MRAFYTEGKVMRNLDVEQKRPNFRTRVRPNRLGFNWLANWFVDRFKNRDKFGQSQLE